MSTRSLTQSKTPPTFTPVQSGVLQRQCASCGQHTIAGGECAECQKKRSPLQRRSTNQAEVSEVPPIVHEVLRSPGKPLDTETRTFMESQFGHDFSQVRVHTDAKAAESAQAVNALAYTVGQDVVFGAEQYKPHLMPQRQLLAHELTHVLQQGQSFNPSTAIKLGKLNNSYEQQADTVAESIAIGLQPIQTVLKDSKAGLLVQRQDAGTNPSTPVPTPTATWTPDLLNILLSDDSDCFGIADPFDKSLYSTCNSPYKPLCQEVRVPFKVEFLADRANAPHPQPSTPMTVRVRFNFTPTGRPSQIIYDKSDSKPAYVAPNQPLKPSFGENFPVEVKTDGIVSVLMELRDPSSGQSVIYYDKIKFVVLCV